MYVPFDKRILNFKIKSVFSELKLDYDFKIYKIDAIKDKNGVKAVFTVFHD